MTDEQIKQEWMKLLFFLMQCGTQFEDCKENGQDIFNIESIFKISVPEFNTLDDNYAPESFLKDIKTMLLDFFYKICECETGDEKKSVQDMIKVYGKIRIGETWTQKDKDELIAVIMAEIKKAKQRRTEFVEV